MYKVIRCGRDFEDFKQNLKKDGYIKIVEEDGFTQYPFIIHAHKNENSVYLEKLSKEVIDSYYQAIGDNWK